MSVANVRCLVYACTYAYLTLPYVIFFGGWMRQPYAAIVVVLLLAGVGAAWMMTRPGAGEANLPNVSIRAGVIGLLAVAAVGLIVGAGGWGTQDSDWLKHNSILRDLIRSPWPVVYETASGGLMLTYYIAYQLPAAVVGKLFGWDAANHALFAYTLFGLTLAAAWVWLLAEARAAWFIVVFLMFSGMDLVGQAISTIYLAPDLTLGIAEFNAKLAEFYHPEWWNGWGFAQFSSTAALMVWVPNQATAGWLLTGLVIADAQAERLHRTGVLYVALCTLWAPFVTLGLLPLAAVLMIWRWAAQRFSAAMLREMVTLPNTAGVVTGLIVAFYLAGRFVPYTVPFDTTGLYEEYITLTFLRLPQLFLVRYVLFIVLEFALLHALLYWYLFRRTVISPVIRLLFYASTAILLALPVLNWGWNNEPAMRTSIPALFVTILVTIRVLSDAGGSARERQLRRAIVALLVVGSLTATIEFGRHVAGIARQGTLVRVPPQQEVETLFELQERRYTGYYNFVAQYVGSPASGFVRYLGKPPVTPPAVRTRSQP